MTAHYSVNEESLKPVLNLSCISQKNVFASKMNKYFSFALKHLLANKSLLLEKRIFFCMIPKKVSCVVTLQSHLD